MRIHWLQHADFEDLGVIAPWLAQHGHSVHGTCLYAGEALPEAAGFDALIVMGGPMNIYEHAAHPWLPAEKRLIAAAVEAGRRVLGICLGAQLLADALGGPVRRNEHSEIGWFEVQLTPEGRQSPLLGGLPQNFKAFHWHGDTYALPPGAQHLATSAGCAQQAFSFGERLLGLQFHLEATYANAAEWFRHESPAPGEYVQSPEEILARPGLFEQNNRWMERVLERFFS